MPPTTSNIPSAPSQVPPVSTPPAGGAKEPQPILRSPIRFMAVDRTLEETLHQLDALDRRPLRSGAPNIASMDEWDAFFIAPTSTGTPGLVATAVQAPVVPPAPQIPHERPEDVMSRIENIKMDQTAQAAKAQMDAQKAQAQIPKAAPVSPANNRNPILEALRKPPVQAGSAAPKQPIPPKPAMPAAPSTLKTFADVIAKAPIPAPQPAAAAKTQTPPAPAKP